MKGVKLTVIAIGLLLFLCVSAPAQWSVSVVCPNPYPSPYLSDWENNPGIISIIITGSTPDTVKLVDSLHSIEHGFVAKGSSADIPFLSSPIEKDNRDFINYRGITYNSEFQEEIIRTNRLLEGTYTLYTYLIRKSTGELIASGNPVTFTILGFQQPSLLTPGDGDTIRVALPTFQWTPATSHPGFEVRYSVKICEILSGQTPQQAINNIPHHEETVVDLTSWTYPVSARPFEENKWYVWQVQAKDRNNIPIGENEGKSDIFRFIFQSVPHGFTISNLQLILPGVVPVGTTVRAKVKFDVSGSGDVQGRFLLDGTPWRVFSHYTETSPDSFLSLPLPANATDTGRHKLKVEIVSPDSLKDSVNYRVTAETLRIDSLCLVPNVAYLKNFSEPPTPEGPAGSNRYRLSGTATMRLISLDNKEVPLCTLQSFNIVLNPANPFNSTIDTGVVQRSCGIDTALFGYKDDFLKITKVRFEKRGSPVDFILINAKLNIPRINITLYEINDLIVRAGGIEGKGVSTTQEFSRWGVTFSLHDIGANKAITIGKSGDTLWASLSGDIKFSRQGTQHLLTQFTNFKVTHQGKITGRFSFADPFRLIPGNSYVKLDTISFFDSLDQYYLRFAGKIESLPKPIDTLLPRTRFSFLLDIDGNTVGRVAPLNELLPDRRGAGNDISEFSIPVLNCTLDLTYLGLVLTIQNGDLKLNQSKIEMALDVYFPFKNDAGNLLSITERRLAIGEIVGNELAGGLTIDFNGNIHWDLPPEIPVIQNKRLDLGDVLKFKLSRLAIEPLPFAFVLNCSLGINISGVGGGAMVEGFKVYTSGDVEYPIIRGGEFKILEVFNVSVGRISWSNRDTTLTFNVDQTTGEGEDRNFQSGTQSISCRGYFLMEDAGINIGEGGRIASGGFDRLLVYKPSGGGSKKVTLTGADLTIAGMQLLADYDYSNPTGTLRFAGTLNIPSGVGVTAVGKIGNRDGNPSFGLFVAARGLQIPVGPGITLVELGGGFFWYPEEIDLQTVRHHCGFTRPEMTNKFQEKRPRSDDPGAFALLLYGGVTFLGTDALVTGRALLTLTTRRFDLDAEAKVLKMAEPAMDAKGTMYLSVGWNPAYAEGRVKVDVNVIELITGNGNFEFYVYSQDAWGVMGGANLKVVRLANAETDFFIGNPGFLLEMSLGFGIDIYVLSGSIDFDGMVWYKRIEPRSWGGYAGLHASAEILGGLAGASFGLEGALIGEPVYIIYCVGSLSVEVLWVEVFSGSIWVSIGKDGFDGGTGRNSRYDKLIEDARNMANQMQEEKNRVKDAMAEAQATMYALSEETRARAGMALIEAAGWRWFLYRTWYFLEENRWISNFGSVPGILIKQRDSALFDAVAESLKVMRDNLSEKERTTRYFLTRRVDTTRVRVDQRLANYQALLEERLPTVREIGTLGSPLQGKNRQTITVSGADTSFTVSGVEVGYELNYAQADEQKRTMSDVQKDNEAYRQELIRIAGVIDEKLLKLDSLLYISTAYQKNDMSSLCSLYQEGYKKVIDYYWYLGDYLEKNQNNAARKRIYLNRNVPYNPNPWTITTISCSSAIYQELQNKVMAIDSLPLLIWTGTRQEIIRVLDTSFQRPSLAVPLRDLRNMWVTYGMEIWYNIPKAGYQGIINLAQARWDSLKAVYQRTTGEYARSWINYTSSLDRVYSRKADLYELLYDLYDQMELMGDVPTPAPQRMVRIEGMRYPMIARTTGFSPISRRKAGLAQLLTSPRITSFTGEYRSDATTPQSFGRLTLNWSATHPVKVVDYSFWIKKEGGFFYTMPQPKTLGLSRELWLPFIYGINEPGDYGIFLRARGAGGYAITRKGVVKVDYYGPDVPQQRNSMSSIDTTPPTRPLITTDTIISSTGQVYASWLSYDAESGVEEYQYTLGTYFYNPTIGRYIYNPLVDWTSSGGRTEVNIRGLNLQHSKTYTLKVRAKNGVGLWSPEATRSIKVDTSPPTIPHILEFTRTLYRGPLTLFARWQRSEDNESGLKKYLYSIGKRPYGTDIVDTTNVRTTFAYFYAGNPKPYREGDTLYLTLRAFNTIGLESTDTTSMVVHFFDNTPPAPFNITVNKNWSVTAYPPRLISVTCNRDSTYDNESGIYSYRYRLETPAGNPVTDWAPMPQRSVTFPISQLESLQPREGFYERRYIFKVEAENGAGLKTTAQAEFTY
ncbi:MAG: hypothetical protein ABIK39_01790 [candidate division WOR-3 bacterium]